MINYNCIEEEALFRLWLHNIPDIYNKDFHLLIDTYKSAYNVYSSISKITDTNISSILSKHQDLNRTKKLFHRLKQDGIQIVFPDHPAYPKKLLDIEYPPQILYIKGHLPKSIHESNKNIAIIGSRFPDSYGREYAHGFAKKLASLGINIISGLAKGIDGYSHRGALDANGTTIAVLGCGINVIYPRENYSLYQDIPQNGAIISEYPPDRKPLPFQFPERNRLISALSDGVLVVEAKKKSGSLITCNYALEQGKPVFAIPGRICDLLSEGTNALIYDGAICTTTPQDITDILFGTVSDRFDNIQNICTEYSKEEQKVLEALSLYDTYIDEIIEKTKLGVTKTINTLLLLQEKGVVKESQKGYYIKTVVM